MGPGAFALAYIAGSPVAIPEGAGNEVADNTEPISQTTLSSLDWII
ncbi:MAG: hypothetical protein KDJ31_19895 [Candidatus Competibacteraceae bacterium]|nr:hypothetical protein [Candidatus Competibacteraceae bacterium]HRY15720.1 hypothetical protein [Candidatus Competibacteraceae bacterium]